MRRRRRRCSSGIQVSLCSAHFDGDNSTLYIGGLVMYLLVGYPQERCWFRKKHTLSSENLDHHFALLFCVHSSEALVQSEWLCGRRREFVASVTGEAPSEQELSCRFGDVVVTMEPS